VDGTQWDLYEQNLLAERHIRYGGYGGIGYYHVSDTYNSPSFSHFIPCGVWEAIYLLDGLLKNLSDIQHRYHPRGYSVAEYAGLWAGGAAGNYAHATDTQLERSDALSPGQAEHLSPTLIRSSPTPLLEPDSNPSAGYAAGGAFH
jgi:hypothetical protein